MYVTALLALFCALCAAAFTVASWLNARRANDAQIACARAAGKLNAMAGRVIALEGALESLSAQHRKLSGKFHATKHSDAPASPDVGAEPAGVRKPAPYCQNFQLAQLGGPNCDAASCECDYCVEMRGRRSATKAALLPAARAATLATSRSRE